MQKPILIACWILFGACLGLSAQGLKPVEPVAPPVPTTEVVLDRYFPTTDIRFLALDDDNEIPGVYEEFHLEAWVAEIKGHYAELHTFANVPDLRDPSGKVMEWRPPMAAFGR